jgi:hypothetical protein
MCVDALTTGLTTIFVALLKIKPGSPTTFSASCSDVILKNSGGHEKSGNEASCDQNESVRVYQAQSITHPIAQQNSAIAATKAQAQPENGMKPNRQERTLR